MTAKITQGQFNKIEFNKQLNIAKIRKESNAMLLIFWATMGTIINYNKSYLARECIRSVWKDIEIKKSY